MVVYVILVPVLVFFLIKDKDRLIAWLTGFLPHERQLSTQVWSEVNAQIANYVRGKFWEILIVGWVTFIVMAFLGLQFAALIAAITGLSVLIPFVGAAVVTAPVAIVAYFQWGLEPQFFWVLLAYGVIQALDGNALVPLLFSEAVNLHPVAIIVAILFFGGLWGRLGRVLRHSAGHGGSGRAARLAETQAPTTRTSQRRIPTTNPRRSRRSSAPAVRHCEEP